MSGVVEKENLSGRELIQGLVAGYETSARVSIAAGVPHRKRGFATTGTANYFGASAATSRLIGLDTNTTVLAMGIAGNEASGLSQHQFGGGHTKHLNSATAARSGIMGALLAREGFRGNTHILEGELGFLHVQCDGGSPEELTKGLEHEIRLSLGSPVFNQLLFDPVLRADLISERDNLVYYFLQTVTAAFGVTLTPASWLKVALEPQLSVGQLDCISDECTSEIQKYNTFF